MVYSIKVIPMKMPKISSIILIIVIILIVILAACMFFSQVIGEKTIVSDTAVLPHGGQKTYSVPPGFAKVNITSGKPIDELYQGIGVSGEGHGITTGSVGLGSVSGATYTVTNPGEAETSVNVHITTGTLNPFAYI